MRVDACGPEGGSAGAEAKYAAYQPHLDCASSATSAQGAVLSAASRWR